MPRPTIRTNVIRRWFTAGLLVAVIVLPLTWLFQREELPDSVHIFSGQPGGLYFQLADAIRLPIQSRIGRSVVVDRTTGSLENVERLRHQENALAIIQGGTVTMDDLSVVTPLYPELLFVIVRKNRAIETLSDLRGRNVALGKSGSGTRHSALALLSHFQIDENDVKDTNRDFRDLEEDESLDAAIVTAGITHTDLHQLMQSKAFQLMPIRTTSAVDLLHPFFSTATIPRGLFSAAPTVPETDIPTLATTAFLVTNQTTSDQIVTAALTAVHEQNLRLVVPALITRDAVAARVATRMHAAAQQYFHPSDQIGTTANIMESLAAIKELLFAFGAGLYLLWLRYRKLRETEREELLSRHKERLDVLLEQTLAIEADQMKSKDVAELRGYLDRVTAIKIQALREFTSEELRGDQAFSIFLDQCTSLIGKLQMKILTDQ